METAAPGPATKSVSKTKTKAQKEKKPKSKEKKDKEPKKKAFKVVIRKLPFENFSVDNFSECVSNISSKLGYPKDVLVVEHFIEGKLRYECLYTAYSTPSYA